MSNKTDLILLVDMGNTHVKWVWASGERIIESSFSRGELSEFLNLNNGPDGGTPDRILLSSVASEASTLRIAESCTGSFGGSVQILRSHKSDAGIENGYEDPAALGVDRWLAIVGAAHSYGMPIVVMDLGTATTLDVVDQEGKHLGGLILPGPALMLESLTTATSMQVPADPASNAGVDRNPTGVGVGPAKSTSSAITEGAYAAQIGALNQFLRNVSAKLKTEPKLVLTGGAAQGIMERLEGVAVFDPWLVFKGMLQVQE